MTHIVSKSARSLGWTAAAFIALASSACTGYSAVESGPQLQGRTLQGSGGGKVRVTLKDGRKLFFGVATLKGDSLIGLTNDGPDGRYAIPYATIKEVATYELQAGETALLVVVVVVASAALVGACVASLSGI